MTPVRVRDILQALHRMTGGRVLFPGQSPDEQPYALWRDSGIVGKAVRELPGLVVGEAEQVVRRVLMSITLTEQVIEVAASIGADLVLTHHPVADGASSGGVPLGDYLKLYGMSLIELHEAYHGLHPGIPYIHGFEMIDKDLALGGIMGNIVMIGRPLPGVSTLGDVLQRLEDILGLPREDVLLECERGLWQQPYAQASTTALRPSVLVGDPAAPVGWAAMVFPHAGFGPDHVPLVRERWPQCRTLILVLSRVEAGHPLVTAVRQAGMQLLCGSTHALEVLENWLPLARALEAMFPGLDIWIARERATALPLAGTQWGPIDQYARKMAQYLTPGARLYVGGGRTGA